MQEITLVRKRLSQARVQQYADAANDHNPIHTDEAFAATTQFGGTIAHGMLVLASISEMMAASLGEAWLTGGKLKVRFKAPAKTTNTLSTSAAALEDGRYTVECKNEDGEVLISGTCAVPLRG